MSNSIVTVVISEYTFVLFFATFFNAYNSFLIVSKKLFLAFQNVPNIKKVQFLMYTFKKVRKN